MKPGRASSTALLIARSTLVTAHDPRRRDLYDPRAVELCELFLRAQLRFAAVRLWCYRQAPYRRLLGALEAISLPGIQLHYALRKKWIEEAVRAGLAEGFRNLQVSGAGFDTLGLRLARERAGLAVLEVDHPSTQQAKTASLGAVGGIPANIAFRALDLGHEGGAEDSLAGALEPGADTLVVAEGVLMYLPENQVRRFFEDLRRQFVGRLRVVFTFMAPDRAGRVRFHNAGRLVDWWLDLKGEPFTWGIAPADLGAFLARAGFELIELAGHEQLRERYLEQQPGAGRLAEGELLAVAQAGQR